MAVAARCQIVPSRVDGLAFALAPTSVRSEMKTVLFAGTTVAALAAASLAPRLPRRHTRVRSCNGIECFWSLSAPLARSQQPSTPPTALPL
jgi:hypothetical protein